MKYDILVVDDSKAALFMFKKIITLSGVPLGSLLTAENGLQAIELLKFKDVDLILTDINMPEMDGFQLIEYLKKSENFKHIPILVITTEGRDKYVDRAKALGAVNYIKKPCQPEQVKQIILSTLGVEEDETNINDTDTGDF
jgi:two-component system, chemotaxis family, chemotaxis protein CheY